jgi:DNA-binding Xre family transcriptional regulator
MAIRNRIKPLVDGMGKSRYRFWKDIGVSQNTAYNLYDDPTQVPTAPVMDKICAAYRVQPGDFLVHIPDEESVAA